MSTKANELIKMAILFLFCLIPTLASAEVATMGEARVVAENWMRFIVERDGHWGGAKSPEIGKFIEFKRGNLLLGYYASVEPQGYIVISLLKDFPPIKAYSATSNLDPEKEVGMCALLKDVWEKRIKFLIKKFGKLETFKPQQLRNFSPDANRLAWLYLLEGGNLLRQNLQSIYPGATAKGPLLKTLWHQHPPYNDHYPDENCPWPNEGNFNKNPPTGCAVIATAQLMRYYAWPPYPEFKFTPYDWKNMLNEYVYDSSLNPPFKDQNGIPVTWDQISAVATLCDDIDDMLWVNPLSDCNDRMHPVCYWAPGVADVRDVLEDHFFYSSPDEDQPKCEERDTYGDDENDFVTWWNMIKDEIDKNRPVIYRIANGAIFKAEFDHVIVVDGYDNTGGMYQVHANYGWPNHVYTTMYTLNTWYCNIWDCSWDEEEMIRPIYPRNGLCESYSGTLDPWGGPTTLHHYVYCDVTSSNLTVEGGARVQFLPGTSITCSANSIEIFGSTPIETRFFSEGDPTRGLKVSGGEIKLHPNGSIRVR